MYIIFRYDVLITKNGDFLNLMTKCGLKIVIGNYNKNSFACCWPPSFIDVRIEIIDPREAKKLFEDEVFKVLSGFSESWVSGSNNFPLVFWHFS